MSEFFEPPPAPDEPSELKPRPPWLNAPEGTLPGIVALELVLARNDRAAVCVTHAAAYSTGFGVELVTITLAGNLNPNMFGPISFRRLQALHAGEGVPPELLRFGIEFADGSKATNTASLFPGPPGDEPPPGPVLRPRGGRGGGASWHQQIWVWPLPPPGPLAFVCEWPAAGVPLTRHEIDAQLILDAAGRAQEIFRDDELGEPAVSGPGSVHARIVPVQPRKPREGS